MVDTVTWHKMRGRQPWTSHLPQPSSPTPHLLTPQPSLSFLTFLPHLPRPLDMQTSDPPYVCVFLYHDFSPSVCPISWNLLSQGVCQSRTHLLDCLSDPVPTCPPLDSSFLPPLTWCSPCPHADPLSAHPLDCGHHT